MADQTRHSDDVLSSEESHLLEGLRANKAAGATGETLSAEEIETLLGLINRLLKRLTPTP